MRRRLLRWITVVMAIALMVVQVPYTVRAEESTKEPVLAAEETIPEEQNEVEEATPEEQSGVKETTPEEQSEAEETEETDPGEQSEAEETTPEEQNKEEKAEKEQVAEEKKIEEPINKFAGQTVYNTFDVQEETIAHLGNPSISSQTSSGISLKFNITVQDQNGIAVSTSGKTNNITLFIQNGETVTQKSGKIKNGAVSLTHRFAAGEYTIYAEFSGSDGYRGATSEKITIKVEGQNLKNKLFSAPSVEGEKTGTITADGDFQKLVYYVWGGNGAEYSVEGNKIENLEGDKTYVVYAPARQEGNTYYLESGREKIAVALTDGAKESEIISDEFDVTLEFAKNEVGAPAVKWTNAGDGTGFKLKKNTYRSVYVKALDTEHYYVESVKSQPENGAKVTYNTRTGEVLIADITEDITLIPVIVEKKVPEKIAVNYQFQFNGNYSEHNPAAIVSFEVTVTDKNGNPVPKATVYFKQDEKEVSPTLQRTTGDDGKLSFCNSYAFGEFENRGDWVSQFALDSAFTKAVVNQDIHIVKQFANELSIFMDQVIGTSPGQENGKVIGVPENYELWTGEFKQGAIVVGTGKWVCPVNGEFTGLAAGQHGIRFGERVDYDNHTFYLASDYDYVTIGRGIWNVSVDENASSHVNFSGELTQAVEPGGIVYISVRPENGYEVSEYTVDKPSYVSGAISYNKEMGLLVVDGVCGNLTITVKAIEVKPGKRDVADASNKKAEPVLINDNYDNNDNNKTGDWITDEAFAVFAAPAENAEPGIKVPAVEQINSATVEVPVEQQTESVIVEPVFEEKSAPEIEKVTIEEEEVPKAGKIVDVSEENVPEKIPYGWIILIVFALTLAGIIIKRVSQQNKTNV